MKQKKTPEQQTVYKKQGEQNKMQILQILIQQKFQKMEKKYIYHQKEKKIKMKKLISIHKQIIQKRKIRRAAQKQQLKVNRKM